MRIIPVIVTPSSGETLRWVPADQRAESLSGSRCALPTAVLCSAQTRLTSSGSTGRAGLADLDLVMSQYRQPIGSGNVKTMHSTWRARRVDVRTSGSAAKRSALFGGPTRRVIAGHPQLPRPCPTDGNIRTLVDLVDWGYAHDCVQQAGATSGPR